MTAVTGAAIVTLICVLSLQSAAPSQADPALIRIYIDARTDARVGSLAELEQSAKDLASALAGKKKLFTIVDGEDKADVVLKVEGRVLTTPKILIGIGSAPGQTTNPATTLPTRQAQLHVSASLAHADESIEIRNKNRANDNPGGWKSAAEDIARQIEKWVGPRREKILAARPKTGSRPFSGVFPPVFRGDAPPDILVGMKGQRI
jgi:hypothetical protein